VLPCQCRGLWLLRGRYSIVGDRYDILSLFDILFDGFSPASALDQATLLLMMGYLSSIMLVYAMCTTFQNGVYNPLYRNVMFQYPIGFVIRLF
jgi:hypothetical protein